MVQAVREPGVRDAALQRIAGIIPYCWARVLSQTSDLSPNSSVSNLMPMA
jgi:hypothetical protein